MGLSAETRESDLAAYRKISIKTCRAETLTFRQRSANELRAIQ